ncbi:hypothetical protein ACFSSA_05640 [Luteolibacter algae]|uniref:DUF2975 domain-containing protein n=1 Tax=Luteolibacter algae TaxID=454151 RepID=A0ABW5D925_9BACT
MNIDDTSRMNQPDIPRFISNTRRRAIRESAVGVLLIGILAYEMRTIVPGTTQFYGTMITILSLAIIIGVLWSYVIDRTTLHLHPKTDVRFWRGAFLSQAKLLRLVPFWYLAPLLAGVVIRLLPSGTTTYWDFVISFIVCMMVFICLTWLNRRGAAKLEMQAQSLT